MSLSLSNALIMIKANQSKLNPSLNLILISEITCDVFQIQLFRYVQMNMRDKFTIFQSEKGTMPNVFSAKTGDPRECATIDRIDCAKCNYTT